MIVAMTFAFGYAGTAATPAPLIGNQAIEGNADSDTAGTAEAFQSTAASSGTASDVFVYVDSTPPAKVTAGVYADAAGHPGALLAQGTLTAPKGAAWNDVRADDLGGAHGGHQVLAHRSLAERIGNGALP